MLSKTCKASIYNEIIENRINSIQWQYSIQRLCDLSVKVDPHI